MLKTFELSDKWNPADNCCHCEPKAF